MNKINLKKKLMLSSFIKVKNYKIINFQNLREMDSFEQNEEGWEVPTKISGRNAYSSYLLFQPLSV